LSAAALPLLAGCDRVLAFAERANEQVERGLFRHTAMDVARPGGRVLLFAQTQHGEATIDPAAVCVDEKALVGSYSASVDLQEESVRFVMNREMDLERLVSHRFPLSESRQALDLAAHPQPSSMKVLIQPGSAWARK
jgi:L-iditol 2-dehydrogenase